VQSIAEKACQLAERYRVFGDYEHRFRVRPDAHSVAHIAAFTVGVELRVELAVDNQHRARLGGEDNVAGRAVGAAVDDFGAAVLAHQENAIGLEMKIAAAIAQIDGVNRLAVGHREPDRTPVEPKHAGVHRESDLGSA